MRGQAKGKAKTRRRRDDHRPTGIPRGKRAAQPPRRAARQHTPEQAMHRIRISSQLAASFRDELERIVFFNPGQPAVAGNLVESVHRYGVPSIVEADGVLRFRVAAFGTLQTLYALYGTAATPQLVGVAMFTRESPSSMVVLHLAVHEDYSSQGRWADTSVIAQLVGAIRSAAQQTRGVRQLRILYPHEIRFALREASPPRDDPPPVTR